VKLYQIYIVYGSKENMFRFMLDDLYNIAVRNQRISEFLIISK